jgi:hypothetical protein
MTADTVALCFAALPFVLALWNLTLFRTPQRVAQPAAVSVIIPARNEEQNIGPTCAAVLNSESVVLELLVLDDHSTDHTATILAGIGDPRLRVIPVPPLPPGWTGKQFACATGAALARYELMAFIDADVRLAPDALGRIAGFMQRERVGLGSGFPREVTSGFADGLLLPLIHFLLLGFLPIAAMRRVRSPAFGAGCGQIIAVWREAYRRAGGHGAVRQTMHDGILLPRAFRRAGIMTGIFDASRFATCRMYETAGALAQGLMKNATEGMAKPVALPLWTGLLGCGHVLPVVLVLTQPDRMALAALAVSVATRLILALRFRAPLWSALLHPLGVTAFLALQWLALIRQHRGRPATWRGRAYAP